MNQYLRRFHECPGCGASSSKTKHLFNVSLLETSCSVGQCSSCGLVYKTFAPTTEGLAQIYSHEYVHFGTDTIDIADFNTAKQKLSKVRKALSGKRLPNELKLLDVGCGSGNFVRIAQNLGYQAEGIDPYLPSQLKSKYLHNKSPEDIPKNSYDIAVLLNVAEHLDQPRQMFSAIRQLLKSDGVMLLTCPYGDSYARRVHQAYWGHLALDEHLLFWTPRSLTKLLREVGFQGKVSYRIAGSPFPYGRVKPQLSTNNSIESQIQASSESKEHKPSLQAQIWQFGRAIQRQQIAANFVRSMIHVTHTGDYLEYVIKVGK